MVHPEIKEIFSNKEETEIFFEWISKQMDEKGRLLQFFKWHIDVISEVINEIEITQKINLSDKNEAETWANIFLKNYDEKIRIMRKNSNHIFERFHELKSQFDKIITLHKQHQEESEEIMQVFLNKHELLVGKIIFSYRELWFLANRIKNSNFKIGSIFEYHEWVKNNFSKLKRNKETLEDIKLLINSRKDHKS